MNLRTTISLEPSERKINYSTPAMFVGSCFASEIGKMMAEGKMEVLVNPTGTVFNPVSVLNTLNIVLANRVFRKKDLYNYEGTYLSFLHYTNFNSDNPDTILERINASTQTAHSFLRKAGFLFITFGTSYIYRFTRTGEIVSNCHKIPASMFERELLTPEQITGDWVQMLDKLHSFNRKLNVIFTVSPVRHWKDGAHGNQVSKSILFLAIEELLGRPSCGGYFPAYELLMDDLRDYRFYDTDMLHPSPVAIEYIWKAFSECYLDPASMTLWREMCGITRSMRHRLISDSPSSKKKFAISMLKQIGIAAGKNPDIDLSVETDYFRELLDSN